MWTIHRGIGTIENGIYPHLDKNYRMFIPPSERSPDYLPRLKTVSELIFDIFLSAYTSAIFAEKSKSERRERRTQMELGTGFRRRNSTTNWDVAMNKSSEAHACLREAHRLRLIDPYQADELACEALNTLQYSSTCIPALEEDWYLLDDWEDREDALMIT
jgi:hypothetical protein